MKSPEMGRPRPHDDVLLLESYRSGLSGAKLVERQTPEFLPHSPVDREVPGDMIQPCWLVCASRHNMFLRDDTAGTPHMFIRPSSVPSPVGRGAAVKNPTIIW